MTFEAIKRGKEGKKKVQKGKKAERERECTKSRRKIHIKSKLRKRSSDIDFFK